MARKALDTGKSFTYAGDKGDVETNAKKADDNFVELYTLVTSLQSQITALAARVTALEEA